jgi:hypothetical protein
LPSWYTMPGREPPDALDFFCTPPWATRALCKHVLFASGGSFPMPLSAWEPAAGEGHMAEVLMEYFQQVRASDVFDYGCGYEVGSFVGCGPDVATVPSVPDWIITNPPFNLACEFALRAISIARAGVALLGRLAWSEGGDRSATCFCRRLANNQRTATIARAAAKRANGRPHGRTHRAPAGTAIICTVAGKAVSAL